LHGARQAVTVWRIDAAASRLPKRSVCPGWTTGGFGVVSDENWSPGR
jgi:hypothetical protein